jgi:hypothetical protein
VGPLVLLPKKERVNMSSPASSNFASQPCDQPHIMQSGTIAIRGIAIGHDITLDDHIVIAFVRTPGGIFDIANGFLNFALDLLRSAVYLGASVASPLANLTFCTSCRIVDSALHSVLVHRSTSVD